MSHHPLDLESNTLKALPEWIWCDLCHNKSYFQVSWNHSSSEFILMALKARLIRQTPRTEASASTLCSSLVPHQWANYTIIALSSSLTSQRLIRNNPNLKNVQQPIAPEQKHLNILYNCKFPCISDLYEKVVCKSNDNWKWTVCLCVSYFYEKDQAPMPPTVAAFYSCLSVLWTQPFESN